MEIQFNKACDPDDWNSRELRQIMHEELHLSHDPDREKSRKNWEWGLGLQALKHYGYLQPHYKALGLGAGHERVLYALTNHLQLVVASDLYGVTKFRSGEGSDSMLRDPKSLYNAPFREDRLMVMNMDGCLQAFGDNHFEVLFSFSSLEHFGNDQRIRQCMQGAYRVLKPGGVFVLAVDYIYREPSLCRLPRRLRPQKAGEFFTASDVERLVLGSAPFRLRQSIDFSVAKEKELNVYDTIRKRAQTGNVHPHIHLKFLGWYFTSLMLVLFKE